MPEIPLYVHLYMNVFHNITNENKISYLVGE